MQITKRPTISIEVSLNDRLFRGVMRMNSGNPSRILFIVWGKECDAPMARVWIKKSGAFVYHAAAPYLNYEESQALLYKLYRFAEKHMEIL